MARLIAAAEEMVISAEKHENKISSTAKAMCLGILGWTEEDMERDKWTIFPDAWLKSAQLGFFIGCVSV